MLSISSIGFNKTPNFYPKPSSLLPLLTKLFTKSPMASSKIVAEYAKTGRSTCKKCSEPISATTLRLGSVTRDARGFDMTKWHHLNCFPNINSVDNINGFSLLKSEDQETLKNLANQPKVAKRNEIGETEEEEGGSSKKKKPKVSKEGSNNKDSESGGVVEFSELEVKSDYKGVTLMPKWKAFQTVIFLEKDEALKDSSKIAAFDFDGCLANTSVKKVGAEAWSLMYPSIPEKLQKLHEDGYKIVIFTNEANIERWKNKRENAIKSKIGRLNGFIELVKVPVQVFIACGYGGEDGYRKPKTGMWRLLEKGFNSGIEIDMEKSFYVGDAAGRDTDHGDADSKFAEAIGLNFHVPEDYFEV